MKILHFKQDYNKKSSVLFAMMALLIGLMLQVACAPNSIHHLAEWKKPSINLQWDDNCPISGSFLLSSSAGETDKCDTLDSAISSNSTKTPRILSNATLANVSTDTEFLNTIFTSASRDLLSQNKNIITYQSTLFALKTSLLFYD